MGYYEAMDIRGIAWAGYFFDPGAVQPPTIFGDGPDMGAEVFGETTIDAKELKPSMVDAQDPLKPPQISADELDPVVDADELKPDMGVID